MKRITILFLMFVTLITTIPAAAQWSWQGVIYFGVNQNLALPVIFNGDVYVTIANGFTVRAPQAVKGNGYKMYKKGGGRFWFQVDNPLFDSDIIYVEKADTVQLNGIFGPFVNDSIGYSYSGSLVSSADSTSFFYLHQNDTVVQTFDASGYNNTNTNLYIYSDTKSTLRMIKSSDKLAGRIILPNEGTLYIDGAYNAKILVEGGKLITGENSSANKDYATFANTFNDSTITISSATMQIGAYAGPSLVNVKSGNVIQENNSTIKIDVYNPATNWGLTSISGISTNWTSSFSDRIYMEEKNYIFKTGSKIEANWNPAYIASIANDTVFYLPVIMLKTSSLQIEGANNVTVVQTLPGWKTDFFIGNGNNGTTQGWGYIRGKKIFMKKSATLYDVQNNGTYPNPVSILYRDTIRYKIEIYNPGNTPAKMTIKDTLPPYLKYASNASSDPYGISAYYGSYSSAGTPAQDTITWFIPNIPLEDTVRLFYRATPKDGACASQPLFINKAYLIIDGYGAVIETNKTYHQGAGISLVTFSALRGGQLLNAEEQALDYKTTPRTGILVIPDEGYEFAGWSHDEYTSLRGETIKADSGIMHYEDIMIYGNVEFRANFVPAADKSTEKKIIPDKAINNNNIEEIALDKVVDNSDKVWSYDNDLYIRTKTGTIAKIYTADGIQQRQLTIIVDGITTVRLERGMYIVTLNGGAGYKVIVE
ncbi:MAG: hypothetical protein LBD80_01750 [Tannerella sp.]|jgi:uncharacterized repeat protein (TIGR01451 family)|nr:hypothetical protein [Tannerella sp.]